jgi:hypothetical protein
MPKPIYEFKEQQKIGTNLILYYIKNSRDNLVFCRHGIALSRVPKGALVWATSGGYEKKNMGPRILTKFWYDVDNTKTTRNFDIRISAVCMEHIN